MPDSANIAQYLPLMAAQQPNRPALKVPRGRTAKGDIDYLSLSFAELDAEVDAWTQHLQQSGVQTGDRTLVMVRQGLPLTAAAFALFKMGAVPVIIDPGMGLKSFLNCVRRSRPRVLLGIPLARMISHLAWKSFRTVQIRVAASGNPLARQKTGPSLNQSTTAPSIFRRPSDLAAILFTSGSTGAPKGVCYEHGMFHAQVRLIRETYAIEPGEIDLPMLPIFALFNPALGMTTVVPEINPSKPAAVDPAKIIQAIQQEGVTNSFGSPTLWGKIADHCLAHGVTLPSVKRVLCAGAPVPAALWEKSKQFLPNGQLHSPYGATEALPISTVSSSEILALSHETFPTASHPIDDKGLLLPSSEAPTTSHLINDNKVVGVVGRGACVGKPIWEVTVKVIKISDAPIATLDRACELPVGEVGEIIVAGPTVTKEYDGLADATAAAKIKGPGVQRKSGTEETGQILDKGEATIWHRMGDCGYIDHEGRLWFCGRKAELVKTDKGILFTEPCEQVFRNIPGVARCALIGLGESERQIPALVVQPEKTLDATAERALASRLRQAAREHVASSGISRFYFHRSFPVDVRHNAKIHRLTLAKWAAGAQAHEIP